MSNLRRTMLAVLAASPWLAWSDSSRRRLKVACLARASPGAVRNMLGRVEAGLAREGVPGVEVRAFVPDSEDAASTARAAASAVSWQPDAIFAAAPPAALAARDATRTIPVVFFAVPDPDILGLVQTVARPGGNVTGSGVEAAALVLKRMELVREILPRATRIAALYRRRPNTPWMLLDRIRDDMAAAAARMGLALDDVEVGPAGLSATLAIAEHLRPDAIVPFGPYDWEPHGGPVDSDLLLREFERRTRILVVAEDAHAVREGLCVAMYDGGSQLAAGIEQLARVLKGAPPAGLPIHFPRQYFVAVNRTAARALGIALPPSVMIRADPVVD